MREYVKNLVSEIIGLTPPQAGKHLKGTAAKKRGEQTTENQIRRVFEGVNKSQVPAARKRRDENTVDFLDGSKCTRESQG